MFLIDKESVFLGKPISFYDICKVYPLKISEIYDESMGDLKYRYYLNLLTMEEEDIKETLEKKGVHLEESIDPLEYLLISADNNDTFFLDLKDAFSTFIKDRVTLLPKINSVLIGNPKNKKMITKDNFKNFQMILRAQNRMSIKEEPPVDEDPMAKKFRLKREERDRIKAKQSQSDENAVTFETLLGSLCIMEIGITPFNVGDLTLYTAKCLLERAQAREQYDTELRMLMAGADSKKIKPKYWVRNLDN